MNPPPGGNEDAARQDAFMAPVSNLEARRRRADRARAERSFLTDFGGRPGDPLPPILTDSPRPWRFKVRMGRRIWTTDEHPQGWYGEDLAVIVEERIRRGETR